MQVKPYGHGGNIVRAWTGHRSVPPVTVTRKGKGAICRSYRTVIEAIPYEHRRNIVREWTVRRSVPPVTGTNIESCVRTMLCLYDLVIIIIF